MMAGRAIGAKDVDAIGDGSAAPLHIACGSGHAQFARWLLAHRANVDCKNLAPPVLAAYTPLFTAAFQGHADCCSVLLQHLADVCSQDIRGMTPLHAALMEPLHLTGNPDPKATELVLRVLLAARA